MQILLIEDEAGIADTVRFALQQDGMQVDWFSEGQAGLAVLQAGGESQKYDLVILDVGLPDTDGFSLCAAIRRVSEVPIIFLTARSEEVDRIVGLEMGGDDYLAKPFSPRELTARVRAILRRTQRHTVSTTKQLTSLQHGRDDSPPTALQVDERAKVIRYRDQVIPLTALQFAVLSTLLHHRGTVFSRADLKQACWEDPAMVLDRVVDTHIRLIRDQLRALNPELADYIVTHRGFGYAVQDHA